MAPLRILILSDGRPGHFNLAEGIAAAIERLGPATTERQPVRRGRWPGAVLAAMTRAKLPAHQMLRSVYGLDADAVPPSDIIVSAGAETLAASVWLARARRVPNIFYGSLRLYNPHDFTLVLTSYARHATLPNHALALKPSRLDPDTLPWAENGTVGTGMLGLLIGGDAGPIRYSDADWQSLLALIESPGMSDAPRWLVANSRRTPAHISDRIAAMAAHPGSAVAEFLDARTAPAGTLPGLLARCTAVLCTADSSSMLSECIWARRPTLALTAELTLFTEAEREYRMWLERNAWCRQVAIASVQRGQIAGLLTGLAPIRDNPLQALGRLLEGRVTAVADMPRHAPRQASA